MLDFIFSDFRLIIQDVFVICLGIAVFIWGGGPERAIFLVWAVVFELLGASFRSVFDLTRQVVEVDMLIASADFTAGVLWIAIALNANRNYPLWIAGLQLLAIFAHVSRGMTDLISPIAYGVMMAAPGWAQLLLLAGGLALHARRKREYGEYRDWRVPVRWGGLLIARKPVDGIRRV